MRNCYACGSSERDTAFPPKRPRAFHLCSDCVVEWPAEQERAARCALWIAFRRVRRVRTRASYRAALRWRDQHPQADLIDLVVARP